MTEIMPDTGRRRPSPTAILAIVGFGVFVAADDLTVVSTMLRPIIGDLGLVLPDGLDDAAWIVNAYLIAFLAIMPIAGRISDVMGRRRAFAGAYALFLGGTTLIPLSVGFDAPFRWFLVGRILTALGGGAMVPIALAVIGDVYPEGRRARALGTLGAIETLGWVWGPLYGALLVRFLSWQWQFWLNIPLAVAGLAGAWWALGGLDRPTRTTRIDWTGAGLLTVALIALNLALLGDAEIQSVTGLDELTGGRQNLRWLYPVAIAAGAAFTWQQSRSDHPLFERRLFRGRTVMIALFVNFAVGAGLVIAMVDVPLFINAVESDLGRAAVHAGTVLSALTAAMAVASYLGGRATERWWYRPPIFAGLALSTGAYAWMGATWSENTSYPLFAVQLAVLGTGFGLTVAPTTSAVVDAAPPDGRGAAAAMVMVVRLLGFSVGLSALTAWGLARFDQLRSTVELPPLTDPEFNDALAAATERLTAQAIAETFTAAAAVLAVGLLTTFALRRSGGTMDPSAEHPDPELARGEPDTAEPDAAADQDTAAVEPETGDMWGVGDPVIGDDAVERLARHVNVLVGTLAVLLIAALAAIALLFGRVADARDDAAAARAELAATRGDLERVEAGAALYASQIQGFQEQLTALEPEISAGVDEAVAGLKKFGASTLSFDVDIDQVIPIDTEVVIKRTVQVPIKTTIPIDQTFDTTIRVDTPIGNFPLDVSVPIAVEVPIDLVVDIPIDETMPIHEEFPIKMTVPIEIEVAETELKGLTDSLATGLESLQAVLDGLGG